jgi:hypothetical protein
MFMNVGMFGMLECWNVRMFECWNVDMELTVVTNRRNNDAINIMI